MNGILWLQWLLVCSSDGVSLLHGAPISKVPVLLAVEAWATRWGTRGYWILLGTSSLRRSWMGCLRVGVIHRVAWMLWLKILPLQLKLIVKPLHLLLVVLRWHERPDSVRAMVKRTLWLH
jgi:hypothetical protein